MAVARTWSGSRPQPSSSNSNSKPFSDRALEFQAQGAVRRLALGLAIGRRLDAVHHRIADELNGDILDRRLIGLRDQLQSLTVESHGLVVLLRDVLGERAQGALEASGRSRALCAGQWLRRPTSRGVNFGAWMI